MKRFFMVLLAVLCLFALMLGMAACKPADQTDDPDNEQPDAPAEDMLDIIKDGKTQYAVVRSEWANKNAGEVEAAKTLRRTLADATDVEVDIHDDFDLDPESTLYEILVGKTNRPESELLPTDLGKDEFFIMVTEKKILIYAGSDLAYERAVTYFLTEYMDYDESTGTCAKTELSVPKELNYRGNFDYPAPIYLIKNIYQLGVGDGDRRNENDIVRLIASLQGVLNRDPEKNGFYMYWDHDTQDIFWLDYMSGEGKWLHDNPCEEIASWDAFWKVFGSYVLELGIVTWDADAPATANVAATVCSVEGYLPVLYSEDSTSLYQWLIGKGVEVKLSLVDKFTGEGTIPDSDTPSTGSIKCDPYIWAMEQYIDRCNPDMLAYVLDGASCIPGNHIYETAEGTNPDYNQLYSHDYYIYNRCFFIDLTCVADEIPCDDPDQPMGTDAKTLATILNYYYEKNNGKMTKLMGFPPWYMKYTKFHDHGKTGEVDLEWAFVEFISQYNFLKEADAAHPAWMTNASLYCQYPSTVKEYENSESPVEEIFDENTRYFTIYIGDYDSSAWLKLMVPTLFESSARGDYPLMWAFNPNLADRVPMIFDYVYENRTDNDYFVTGDSGAGYVFPSSLPDLDVWVEFNEPYMDKFDMDIVGFIINGHDNLTKREFAAYAEIAPVGSFYNGGSGYLTVYNDETPYMKMNAGVDPNQEGFEQAMYDWIHSSGTHFAAYRTIRQTTDDIVKCITEFIEFANAKNDGYTYKYVDPYTLFDLILQSGEGNYVYGD